MSSKKSALQYFWILLGCCTMSAASMGICIYSSGVFFEAVSSGLAISLSTISMTSTLSMVALAITTIFLPYLFKVMPYRWILTISAALSLGGILGMSFSFNAFWLDLFSICKGVGAAGFGLVPATYIINNWFLSKRDFIIGLAAASSAAAGALMIFILGASVNGLGWRMGYVIQAILLGICLLPPFLLPFSLHPEGLGMEPFGKPEEKKVQVIPGKKNFLYIAGVAVLVSLISAVPQYFSSYVTFLGQPAMLGASLLSYAMLGNFVFKILGGFFAGRGGIIYTALGLAIITLFADLGMALCEFSFATFTIMAMSFLFGACYGLSELCLPILVSTYFPRRSYVRIYSLVSAFSLFTAALGVLIIGSGIDFFGSYSWIWLFSGLLLIGAMYLLWILSGHSLDTGIRLTQSAKTASQPVSQAQGNKDETTANQENLNDNLIEIDESIEESQKDDQG